MKYDYQYKIIFRLNEPFDVDYVKRICNQFPNSKILVEVQNTKGISSSMIRQLGSNVAIRIAGGYDEERKNRYGKDLDWSTNYYEEAVIYTKNETIKILEEIEKIESGINKNWTDIQKLLYIYDRLKTSIMYDPKYEHKLSSEIRSLRGLISKKTVCAGYAMILKEFMDRSGISCEYVEGYINVDSNGKKTGGHAWNIINIDGMKIPIDLTWDNTKYRSGQSKSFDWLGKDGSTFSKSHHPAPGEKTQDYEHTLSHIDPQIIVQMYYQMGIGRARNYQSAPYYGTRKDGSKFIIIQIGDSVIDNTNYYRYYYVDISSDGKKQDPLILFSSTNIAYLMDCKNFGRPIPPNYEEAINNILFSRENIADSLAKKTYFIGGVRKNENKNKLEFVTSPQEIVKKEEQRKLFIYPTRRFTRSDGSVIIVQQMLPTPRKINGIDVMKYDIIEMVNENGKDVLKRNEVYTEEDLFKDDRKIIPNVLLSRERLDRKVKETGGYIGYIDKGTKEFNITNSNKSLIDFFKTSKKIDIDSFNSQKQNANSPIPSFSELKTLSEKYEVFIDQNDPLSTIKIRDIKTGQIQTDQSIIDKAIFANIWLASAGIKIFQNESRPGEIYAFNEQAEELYNIICKELLDSCKNKGVIDTVDLFKNIENNNVYKYNQEIIVNLFKSQFQTEIINKLFLQSLGINQQKQMPKALYTMSYASKIAYDDSNTIKR